MKQRICQNPNCNKPSQPKYQNGKVCGYHRNWNPSQEINQPSLSKTDLNPVQTEKLTASNITELSFVQGTSDKFYKVEHEGSTVTITYGRNGTAGTQKVKDFDSETKAADFAKKQLAGKLKKGYQPVASANPSQAFVNDFEGVNIEAVPMLAKVASPEDVQRMINDDNWSAQVKMDGDRLVVSLENGQKGAFNRQGMAKQRNVGKAHLEAFDGLEGDWIIDGEVVGRTFHVFDVIKAPGMNEDASFEERFEIISEAFDEYGLHDNEAVALVTTATSPDDKQSLRDETRVNRGEGLIFRRNNAPYTHGRSDAIVKDKFTKSADVIVMSSNASEGKESVEVGIKVNGKLKRVGSLSTIGKRDIKEGDVIEASFKHVIDTSNPVLVEGRIERIRYDKSADECDLEQFENSGTNIGKNL